ncbi:hypothetical protein [Sulfurospirillum sp. hDNRA2]|uniref:hypothetical protein n=1 Tax=Sulfurospirillum sp. hDNRA2 TaxID=3237298 RepID=UPI0020B687BA|nr:hypothetical protein [Sulfurospirillum sp. DNRA8]MCP3653213.1 hypothetical protein [Sulfurospirillum sp. DNRA8]MCR1812064.1 hypothetical protein [Sulfurospirillum sp. DNRA8]
MIGFVNFKDSLKKAPKSKLVLIANLLEISSKYRKKILYTLIVSELGYFYDKNHYVDIEEMNKKIFNILNS